MVAMVARRRAWLREWPLPVALVIIAVGWPIQGLYGLGAHKFHPVMVGIGFVLFFGGALVSALAAARHAEGLAVHFGEPYGTLILTLSSITLEIVTIATVMLHGANNPVFGRDTMFSSLMIVLNGVFGAALLVGGLRHHDQTYNLRGANAFLSLLVPLSCLAMIWPNVTLSSGVGTLSRAQTIFLIVMSLLLYAAFLVLQTRTHSSDFKEEAIDEAIEEEDSGWLRHALLLATLLVVVVFLARLVALPLDISIQHLGLPPAIGGLAVAVLVLAPEGISAIRAAAGNHVQRAMNIGLGTALSTIALTVSAVLMIDLVLGRTAWLGLDQADTMLLLTFLVSMLTLGSGRTNAMQGLVHLLLFLVYIVLLFAP